MVWQPSAAAGVVIAATYLAIAVVIGRPLARSNQLGANRLGTTFHVPSLDEGIAFYVDRLGHPFRWRNDDIGAAAVALPESDTEIVLTTHHGYEPNWLVDSTDAAAESVEAAGGRVLAAPFDIPVGRVAVVADPFDNVLVLIDRSKGRYATDDHGIVTAVVKDA